MQWFRMYGEFATDPKVQSMDEAMQRRFVMLLCLNASEELPKLNDDELAFALRISADDLARTKEVFQKKGLIDAEGGIANWDKRQFVSDSSGDRVRKYRDKRRSLGLSSNGYTRHSDTVIARDKGRCVYCDSAEKLCLDHVLPVSLGGNDAIENLVAACKACNSGKAGRTPDQAGYSWRNQDAKKRWEAWMSRRVTVTVTPSETDSESDTERNKRVPSEPVAQKRDDGPAARIFAHWRTEYRHPKASLDPKRRRAIQRALEAYDEATVCAAISGYKLSPHHMGQNDQRTVYDDISLFLRDAEHIERGLNFARAPPVAAKSAVELARERLRNANGSGDGRVVSEQFGSGDRSLGQAAGILRRLPDS